MEFAILSTIGIVSLSSLLLYQYPTSANTQHFNYHVLLKPFTSRDGQVECQRLGYHNLASLSTPEAFVYALKVTEPYIVQWEDAINVGLFYNQGRLQWADGSSPAPDTPWRKDQPAITKLKPYGRILDGKISMLAGNFKKISLCGNYSTEERIVQGTTHHGYKPGKVTLGNNLNTTKASSYLKCVTLCGLNNWCRAAEFNSDLLTCVTYDATMYYGLDDAPSRSTFLRRNYSSLEVS